jgi:hypothetical protein
VYVRETERETERERERGRERWSEKRRGIVNLRERAANKNPGGEGRGTRARHG